MEKKKEAKRMKKFFKKISLFLATKFL